eukprot:gnl/TRDRNA2_/TRDRNA2_156510_c0_seq1.p1 gnl/TRDRNA2_/TRDRNA2_156510_c0~~gnl/TRDRNA2_/TRDRNA2_156510_c0_seq1.p1  ORF type:complete len:338 (-),score=67.55 gnl/TRDRNA2_/TRDRNA2_156510_c0_seq1:76-1089(-)
MSVNGTYGMGDDEVARKVKSSLTVHEGFWSEEACHEVELFIETLGEMGRKGKFRAKTLDRTPLRSKYFFGYGYTYGSQISKKGGEQILPPELIDPVPDFIYDKLILPLEERGVVPEGWINSAVVNDYRPGGMIVSHIDPPQLFARPIFITSFFAEGRLVFGSRFSFPNKGGLPETTTPKCICPMPRGSLTVMEGYSADGITHGIRPQDLDGRRVSIVLRHVFPNAPRLGQAPMSDADAFAVPCPALTSVTEPQPETDVDIEQQSAPVLVKAAEEIDEFGRRREKNKGDDISAATEEAADDSALQSKGKRMTDKQKAAVMRLQQRKNPKPTRSRSPRR